MRDIKFRIWDNQLEDYITNDASFHCFSHWVIDAFTGNLIDAVGIIGGDRVDPSNRMLECSSNYYFKGSDLIQAPRNKLEQFTNIKDISGKDIYEGDVVSIINDTTLKWLAVISFRNGGFHITSLDRDMNYHDMNIKLIDHKVLVIGNINKTYKEFYNRYEL